MLKFNNSENLKPGIYRAHFNPDKTISTTLLYNNTDAVDLLNRIYKLSKPQSWKNNKIELDIDGGFKDSDFICTSEGNFSTKSWRFRTVPANDPNSYCHVEKKIFGKNLLRMYSDNMYILISQEYIFCFDQDKVIIEGFVDRPVELQIS